MNYAQMNQHNCRTVLQPCFDVSMLPKVSTEDDGYVCQQMDAVTIWNCLVEHGEMSASMVTALLETKLKTACRRLLLMRQDGNVTIRIDAETKTKFYSATHKRPADSPVYAVRRALIKNACATCICLCELTHLTINQVRAALYQLDNEGLLEASRTSPALYSLKGTA